MRLATFNIHHGTVGAKGPVDPEGLGAACAALDADVLALQEVDVGARRSGAADLAAEAGRSCGMQHVFAASRPLPGGGWYGNALLVRGTILEHAVQRLPQVPFYRLRQERRTLLVATVEVAGVVLSVGVSHLATRPAVSARQLEVVGRQLSRRPPPKVLLGDLNRTPDQIGSTLASSGLTVLADGGPTFSAARPRTRIDHIAVTGLRPSRVWTEASPMSDHLALLAEVELVADVEESVGSGGQQG